MLILDSANSSEIPAWVCWIAQDADGVWWGYQVEPNLSHLSWYENEVGDSVRLGKGAQGLDWKSTLKRLR
jgi:hypothetical protein